MKAINTAFVVVVMLSIPTMAHAACTDDDQVIKVNKLGELLTVLVQKDATRAGAITEGMGKAMALEGDAACAALDKLITAAK